MRAVRWSETSNLSVGSSSDDTTVRIWDVSTGNCSQRFDGTRIRRALESGGQIAYGRAARTTTVLGCGMPEWTRRGNDYTTYRSSRRYMLVSKC